ncbi:MAG: SDR family NAD(P)-dependent oxidoreductase [Bacilli bacterium]
MKYLKWVNKNCSSLAGKNVIVTGANSGIGLELTKYLCFLGAHVIMACRSLSRAETAKNKILEEVPNASLEIMEYDQSDSKSIENFHSNFCQKYDTLYALVNNAGIYHPAKNSKASNGYPLTIMTNYLGGYYLSQLLLPMLEKNEDSRLIFECSLAANFNKYKNLEFLSSSMKNTNIEYNLSKLAIGKAFYYIASQDHNTKVLMAHPGVASTNIFSSKGNSFARWFKWLATKLLPIFVHSTAKASLGLLKCVANKNIENGTYLGPRGLFHIGGYPKVIKPSKYLRKNNDELITETENLILKLK